MKEYDDWLVMCHKLLQGKIYVVSNEIISLYERAQMFKCNEILWINFMDIKHRDNRQKWGLCDNVRL
jgi:hypothetical protein